MTRYLSLLALPFVVIAMVVAPLLGVHFCREEAAVVLTGAVSVPFVGPFIKASLKAHPLQSLKAKFFRKKPSCPCGHAGSERHI